MALFYSCLAITSERCELSKEETAHMKVLRVKISDTVEITDGLGQIFEGEVVSISKTAKLHLFSFPKPIRQSKKKGIHLCIAPTKNLDRLSFLVEKVTEIGVDSISFFSSRFSVRKEVKIEKLKKKVIAAMKQSGQGFLPEIFAITSFEQLVARSSRQCAHYLAYVPQSSSDFLADILDGTVEKCLWVGPEGGFADEEVQTAAEAGFQSCSLGYNRLRTETAGIVGIQILNSAIISHSNFQFRVK